MGRSSVGGGERKNRSCEGRICASRGKKEEDQPAQNLRTSKECLFPSEKRESNSLWPDEGRRSRHRIREKEIFYLLKRFSSNEKGEGRAALITARECRFGKKNES